MLFMLRVLSMILPRSASPAIRMIIRLTYIQLREIMDLKQFVLGNARLLYGSEARKFFGMTNNFYVLLFA